MRFACTLLIVSLTACGWKTGLDTGARRADAGIDAPLGPCTHLEVVSGPELWWPSTDRGVSWRSPKLIGRDGGFDLVVRRSSVDHPHIHARRLEFRGDGVRPGPEERVVDETHDAHQITAAGERLAICSGADPGGPLRVVFRGYRGAYRDRIASELPGSSSCQGLIAADGGFQIAYTTREMEARGMFASLSVAGEPVGESVQPLAERSDIEATIRLGRFDGGWAWLKRTRERNQYFVGMVSAGSTVVAQHEAENKALYLRAENWPLDDGTLALSYIDTPEETEFGARHLLVVDESGTELHRHVSSVTRFSFIEPEMRETPDGLVWATPTVREFDDVDIVVELFTSGATRLGEPIVFTETGGGHSSISVGFSHGFIAVAWDRRTEDGTRDEVAGALLRCVR